MGRLPAITTERGDLLVDWADYVMRWGACDQELRDCQAALPGQQVNCFEMMQYASLLELQISMCLNRPCTYEHEQLAIIETALNAYCR